MGTPSAVEPGGDAGSPAKSKSCDMLPPPLPPKRRKTLPIPQVDAGAPCASGGDSEVVPSCAPRPFDLPGPSVPSSLLAEVDDDDDQNATVAGPLAEGEVAALPAAPAGADKAKPTACDLDLDIFGMPEEALMEAVD